MATRTFIVDFFKLIFGGNVIIDGTEAQLAPLASMLLAFVLLLIGFTLVITSFVLPLVKKGNNKLQLVLSIQIAASLITAGIVFLCSKQLIYRDSDLLRSIFNTYEQYSNILKISYVPYVMGSFALIAGIAYPTANIILNKLYKFDKERA